MFLTSEDVHVKASHVNYQHVYNNNIPVQRGTTLGSVLHTYQRTHRPFKIMPIFFNVLLTVHLSVILATNQLDAQNLVLQ